MGMNEIIPRTPNLQDFADPSVRDKARKLYYSGAIPSEIAQALQVPILDVRRAVFGKDEKGTDPRCWKRMKIQRDKELGVESKSTVSTYEKTKYYYLKQTEAGLLDLVRKSLDNLEKEGTLLYTVPEIKQALEALAKLDTIGRLEAGQPTQRVQIEHGLSLREIDDMVVRKENSPIVIDGEAREI